MAEHDRSGRLSDTLRNWSWSLASHPWPGWLAVAQILGPHVQGSADQDGAGLIAAERRRQVDVEGWTADHDARQTRGELVTAALIYLGPLPPSAWPWPNTVPWMGDDPVERMVKAGALIAAEIDRRRAAEQAGGDQP